MGMVIVLLIIAFDQALIINTSAQASGKLWGFELCKMARGLQGI